MSEKYFKAHLIKKLIIEINTDIKTEKNTMKSESLLAKANADYPILNPVTAQNEAIIKTIAATKVVSLLINFCYFVKPKLIQIISFGYEALSILI